MKIGTISIENLININNFNAPSISYIDYMFESCEKLTSIIFFKF